MRFVSQARLLTACAALVAGCSPSSAARTEEGDAGGDEAGAEEVSPDAADPAPARDAAAPSRDAAADSVSAGDAAGYDALPATVPPPWLGPSSLIVAVGNDGRRMVSTDGNTWTGEVKDATGNRDGPKALRGVAYGNRTVVAVGGGCTPECTSRVLTYDGKTWSEVIAPGLPPNQGRLNGVAFGNDVWVAVGGATGNVGTSMRSLDNGRTWTSAGPMAMLTGLRAVSFGRVGDVDMFVAVGDGFGRAHSLDGITWTDVQPSNGSSDSYKAVAIGNGVAVAVGGRSSAGRRARSLDGVTWTDEINSGPDLLSLVFIDGRFMAFSGSGDDTLHHSPDGKAWTTANTVNAGANVAAGALGPARFFISRVSPASIRVSVDGFTWTSRAMSLQGDAQINGFVFAGY